MGSLARQLSGNKAIVRHIWITWAVLYFEPHAAPITPADTTPPATYQKKVTHGQKGGTQHIYFLGGGFKYFFIFTP